MSPFPISPEVTPAIISYRLARAELQNGAGVVLAAATGKYLPIREIDAAEMATDFVRDISWVLARNTAGL